MSGSSCAYKRQLGNKSWQQVVSVSSMASRPASPVPPCAFHGESSGDDVRRSVCGAGSSSAFFFFFFFLLLVVSVVATISQLEQEQEREWVRRAVAMTCLRMLRS